LILEVDNEPINNSILTPKTPKTPSNVQAKLEGKINMENSKKAEFNESEYKNSKENGKTADFNEREYKNSKENSKTAEINE